MLESEEQARRLGFVETIWGRRRHIPEMQLLPYEVKLSSKSFDPFFDSQSLGVVDEAEKLRIEYTNKLINARDNKQRSWIKKQAQQQNITIIDNNREIEEAKRQCVNSRVQGSAADQAKIAIRLIGTNEILKKYKFNMTLLVHDEIIGECPVIFAKNVVPIFKQCMLDAANDLRTGAKCDCTLTYKWYGEEINLEDL